MEKPRHLIRRTLPSERKSVRAVEKILTDFSGKIDLNEELYFKLLIAITEAVNNAVIHGNKIDKAKQVKLSIEAYSNEIVVIVSDEGKGFDYENLADPRDPENLFKESGRGVFIMKEMCDEISFSVIPQGTQVIMKFVLKK